MKIENNTAVSFRKYLFYTVAFVLLLLPFSYVLSVYATPIYGKYPSQGLFKMSLKKTNDRGQIGISSTRAYDQNFMNAYSSVRSSTTGYTEMSNTVWSKGFNMVPINWTGTWNQNVDIMVNFEDRGEKKSSGETFRVLVPMGFCNLWGAIYPCGMRPTITINTYKWDGNSANNYTPMSSTSKKRLIMHETGHAVGMKDYCLEDSIMNNGANDPNTGAICNPVFNGSKNVPKWTQITGYKATDRSVVNSVYR